MKTRKPNLRSISELKKCDDKNCPFHGNISIRGKTLEGTITSLKMNKSAVVKREYLYYISKYKRYERRNSKLTIHIPPCISTSVGDFVIIGESKPISKTIHHVLIGSKSELSK